MKFRNIFASTLVLTVVSFAVCSISLGAIAVKEGQNPFLAMKSKAIQSGDMIPIELSETYNMELVSKIELSTVSADVELVPSADDQVHLKLTGLATKNELPEIKIRGTKKNGVLIVEVLEFEPADEAKANHHSNPNLWNMNFQYKDLKAQLSVPKSAQHLALQTVSGDVMLTESPKNYLRITTVSGDTEGKALSVREAKVETVSGDALLSFSNVEKARFNSVSGDLNLELATADADVGVGSVSGDTKVRYPNGPSMKLRFDTVSGDLEYAGNKIDDESKWILDFNLKNSAAKGTLSLETVSGDVEVF